MYIDNFGLLWWQFVYDPRTNQIEKILVHTCNLIYKWTFDVEVIHAPQTINATQSNRIYKPTTQLQYQTRIKGSGLDFQTGWLTALVWVAPYMLTQLDLYYFKLPTHLQPNRQIRSSSLNF